MRLIRSVADFDVATVEGLLDRAARLSCGHPTRPLPREALVGLLFLDTSLRTRIGFASAAARLGITTVTVDAARSSPRSMPESWPHTLRTMAGYVDAVVARLDQPLEDQQIPPGITVPALNAGDAGPAAEHPSQALIDAFALRQLLGGIDGIHLAVVGDLRMRSVRSLLSLLARTPPRALHLVTVPGLMDGFSLPPELSGVADFRPLDAVDDADALYVAGIPHAAVDESGRSALRITKDVVRRLKRDSVVLSPLPVIDEMEPDVFWDRRVQAFQQSDLGLYVRMAMIEYLLTEATHD